MGKLILETQISIDGFIADNKGGTDWMIWNWGQDWAWDKALQSYHIQLNKSAKGIIISSQMAQEGFNLHWLHVTQSPEDPRYDFAKHICTTLKYVVTKTLTKENEIPGGWSKTVILNGDLVTAITELKDKTQGDLIVYGGSRLVSNLIIANLIDEYHLIINPVALGSGLSIFKKEISLKLVNASSFECGISVAHYKKYDNEFKEIKN